MADNIQRAGKILVPIKVRLVGDYYQIEDGELRWLAALKLGIEIVPVLIIQHDHQISAAEALIFNAVPESIAPEEVISSLEKLVDSFGADAAEIVVERLPELREAAASSPEFKDRLNALLARCNIDSQS